MEFIKKFKENLSWDWYLFVPALTISLFGLVTMNSFSSENYFFTRQCIWILLSLIVFVVTTSIDWSFLRRRGVVVSIFLITLLALISLFAIGQVTKGAQRWLDLGFFAFQPSDLAKIVLIMMLAKYFSRRHVEIANIRHIIISGLYTFIIALPILLQPNLGTAVVIALIWLGMTLVSGISKKHLLAIMLIGVVAVGGLWQFALAPYQKARVMSFVNPLSDVHGAGYNVRQSVIAVGSGQILGKGIGEGSQSKLKYLPEYETDFIFAAFAEEWGFVGAVILFTLCLILLYRIINNASHAPTNFEALFGLGVAILFTLHIGVHAGMNVGLLPVTGITFPFMSYGGSHLVIEWFSLGLLSSFKKRSLGPRNV